jgi:hypothetical protein
LTYSIIQRHIIKVISGCTHYDPTSGTKKYLYVAAAREIIDP